MITAMQGQPTILLVHGAWHGAWCWDKLVPELAIRGWNVETVDLPSASANPDNSAGMYDDARTIRERLGNIEGPVTVLAHSYGGVPVTEAAAGASNVAHLIYLSAFQLDRGESLTNQSGGQLPDGRTGTLPIPEDTVKNFYGDVATPDADSALERLVPQTIKSFSEPLTAAAWNTITSTYIACEHDGILPLAFQEAMSQRADHTYRLASSHSPFLSMPVELAQLITKAAARAADGHTQKTTSR
ncbi:alpha/beta fold hydrolase [Streptomyces sp. NPDC048512]|uniref:alpha/beta fold hydrolase n=1 Tax=Streptomyces sp. NPDC048512 TaxID=3365563 RepID=UPI003713F041